MPQLSIGKGPLASWTVREMLKELGYESALKDGKVRVDNDGQVTVQGEGGVAFQAKLHTQGELKAMLKVLGARVPSVSTTSTVAGQRPLDVLLRARGSQFENRVNERLWYGVQLQTDLKPEYRMGQRFDLPLKRLPPGESKVITVRYQDDVLEAAKKAFVQDDGSVLCPVHPQEAPFRGMTHNEGTIPGVRCASSERTLHAGLPGAPDVMIKLDLAHITHSLVKRPIDEGAAEGAVRMTEFLQGWIDREDRSRQAAGITAEDPFCIFPEVMAIVDVKADAAAIIRSPEPFPPPPGGEQRWFIPMYSLSARDQDFPGEPPPLLRMIRDRPDKSVSELQYFEDKFLRPLIASAMRAHLDLGSSCQAHGQNTYLEVGEDGQPSGRVAHQDLEAFWPHPEMARQTGREDFFAKHGIKHKESAKEAQVYGTFRAYFWSQNVEPLVACFAEHTGDRSGETLRRAQGILDAEVNERADVVRALSGGALKGFEMHLPRKPKQDG